MGSSGLELGIEELGIEEYDLDADTAYWTMSGTSRRSPGIVLVSATPCYHYNFLSSSRDVQEIAQNGLNADRAITIEHCKLTEEGAYNFRLIHQVELKLDFNHLPYCTCGGTKDGVGCMHVFWFLHNMRRQDGVDSGRRIKPWEIRPDGSMMQGQTPIELVEQIGVERLAGNVLRPEEVDELDDEGIKDILSIFNPEARFPPELIPEARQIYRKICEEIAHYAYNHDGFYHRLLRLTHAEFRNQVYFGKIRTQIEQAFEDFSNGVVYGGNYLLFATQLEERYLGDIQRGIRSSRADREDGAHAAVLALLSLLHHVVDDEHLTHILIVSQENKVESFVLDVLKEISRNVIRQYAGELEEIQGRISDEAVNFSNQIGALINGGRRRARRHREEGGPSQRRRR